VSDEIDYFSDPPDGVEDLIGSIGCKHEGGPKYTVTGYAGSVQRSQIRKRSESRYLGNSFSQYRSPRMSLGRKHQWWVELGGEKFIQSSKAIRGGIERANRDE
jgi:hypothetical protein